MNAKNLTSKFKLLLNYEKEMNYKYQPRFPKEKKDWKRHINFKDFKEDFIYDLSMFGFSPFILKTSKEQLKDPNIMRYKPRNFNYGLMNYVKRKQVNINQNKPISRCISESLKKLNQTPSKEKMFLSQALKQITRKSAHNLFNEENLTSDSNNNMIYIKPKENIKTTAATNSTDNGGLMYSQRKIIFHKVVGFNSNQNSKFESVNDRKVLNSAGLIHKSTNSNLLFQGNNTNNMHNFSSQALIFNNQKIRNSISQLKLVNSMSCAPIPKNSSNNKDMNKTRNKNSYCNRDMLSGYNLFSKARILCKVNLSS